MRLTRAMFAVALVSLPKLGQADSCSQANPSQGISVGDQLNVSSDQMPTSDISNAISYWSGTCAGYGTRFPSMRAGGSGGIPISVVYIDTQSPLPTGSCGRTTPVLVAPSLLVRSAKIEIWRSQSNGVACNRVDTLAHELGHVLGLSDNYQAACSGRIMGQRPANGTRSVSASDCGVAAERWATSIEGPPSPIGRPPRCRDY